MLAIQHVIFNHTYYKCICCGKTLFRDDDEESNEWSFCPYCGEPLYEPEVSTTA